MRVILGVKKRREKKFLRVERNSNSSAGVPQLRRPPRTGGEGGGGGAFRQTRQQVGERERPNYGRL